MQVDESEDCTGSVGEELPGNDVRMVFHLGEDDLIAFADECITPGIGDEVDGFGRIAGKDDVLCIAGAHEAGNLFASIFVLVGGALSNYLLEKVPANDRPAYLAWYNLALNAAILLGALLGPLLASMFDLTVALALSFVFRLVGSLLIWLAEPRPKALAT